MIVREFLYLDSGSLKDYAAAVEPALLEGYRESHEFGDSKGLRGGLGVEGVASAGGEKAHREETQLELVGKYTDRHLFSRIYEHLESQIHTFDEYELIDVDSLKRRQVVEVTRDFQLSPVNEMIRGVFDAFDLLSNLRSAGVQIPNDNDETKSMLDQMSVIFRANEEGDDLPLIAPPLDLQEGHTANASVVFIAGESHLAVDPDDLAGELTLFGRIRRIVPEGNQLDLIDEMKLFNRSLRRSKEMNRQMKDAILNAFEKFPEQLGGPFDRSRSIVPGPSIVVSPLAIYL